MELKDIKSVYFIGAGGIGMSAIARYFITRGIFVAGYDKTPSALTSQLGREGMMIHYDDNPRLIPDECRDAGACLVVYTPAVPENLAELLFFREKNFTVEKRAQVLGTLTRSHKGLCVAGTHGKTTTSAMCAHIMHQSHIDCNAFLGGITKNYGTNYILSPTSDYIVIEADEYDRSFHYLRPLMAVITSADADHLDIYANKEEYLESFAHFTELIKPDGALIMHRGLPLTPRQKEGVALYTYSRDNGDFHADNIRVRNGEIIFDFISVIKSVRDIPLGQPIPINIENGVAAMALAQLNGCDEEELRAGMASYRGVDRRFDFQIRDGNIIFLSDYAHHPKEIQQCALSLRELFPNHSITAIFQPHLYSRTRDFHKEFAESLSLFDRVALTEIYPARETPIEGVTSKLIYDNIAPGVEKELIKRNDVLNYVENRSFDVLVSLGAGDLDTLTPKIKQILKKKYNLC